MGSFTKRSTSGFVFVAIVCLFLNNNNNAVAARSLKQASLSAAASRGAATANVAPVSEALAVPASLGTARAVPALEVAGPAPRAETVGPRVQGPAGEQVSASQALFAAIRAKNLGRVQSLLASGADTDVYDANGSTPLIDAIVGGAGGIVNVLIPKTDTNRPQLPSGRTALYFALINGNLDLATRLLNAGADLNLAAANGDTPLFALLKQKPVNYRAIELVLSRTPSATTSAVDLTKTDASGKTAEQIARASGDQRLIALFTGLAPAGEAMPVIPAISTTSGGAGAAGSATALPLVVTAPVSEIVGLVPSSEGALPVVAPGVPVAETLATAPESTLLP